MHGCVHVTRVAFRGYAGCVLHKGYLTEEGLWAEIYLHSALGGMGPGMGLCWPRKKNHLFKMYCVKFPDQLVEAQPLLTHEKISLFICVFLTLHAIM